MPEADQEGERYAADRPQAAPGFFLKGSRQPDWGRKNRLSLKTTADVTTVDGDNIAAALR